MPLSISRQHACRFLLQKQGLLGLSPFTGKQGILDFMKQAGCVQYDPVDVCGKSHELTLLARIQGFTRDMLWDLLYTDRQLIDYFDKNMCIMHTTDWPYLEPIRAYYREHVRGRETINEPAEAVRAYLRQHGHANSQELPLAGSMDWYWSQTSLNRATLEALYFSGELMIHHKRNTIKSYALTKSLLPGELLHMPNPCQTVLEQQCWQVLRRIGAIGLLWNRASDAWLGIGDLKSPARNAVFERLEEQGAIKPVNVEGLQLYLRAEDWPLLLSCESPDKPHSKKSARLLAPLDSLLWDRKLIFALFGFAYTWEIYTPPAKRVYGYYTLPVLYGENLVGRVEPMRDRKRKALLMKRFWPEKGFKVTEGFRKALQHEAQRLAIFHGYTLVIWEEGFWDGKPAQ